MPCFCRFGGALCLHRGWEKINRDMLLSSRGHKKLRLWRILGLQQALLACSRGDFNVPRKLKVERLVHEGKYVGAASRCFEMIGMGIHPAARRMHDPGDVNTKFIFHGRG